MDRKEISRILINALGGEEEAKITINHPQGEVGETTITSTAREVAENLADRLLDAGLH